MKTRVTGFALVAVLTCVGIAAAAQAVRSVPRISIDEVKALMAKKQVVLIDVRDPQSFAEGHMPDAINVPFDHIPKHVDQWKKEKRLLVTYCA
ncbi:MAG: rhodanese-like domain-containing protein [Acidobacteria bacterium]|nr:rhodanese-like domain-containing protein [Acidobacteriota bacterium]